jgi:hypothetical protein
VPWDRKHTNWVGIPRLCRREAEAGTLAPVTVDGVAPGEVSTGSEYEAERATRRERLASTAGLRRVELGGDLVLVFQTRETVRTALEEMLRSERVVDPERIAIESAAFAELLGGEDEVVATLFVDAADPVALGDRLGELPGIAGTVSLSVEGSRVPARPEAADGTPGAFRLRFAMGRDQRTAVLDGAEVTAIVDHTSFRASATLSAEQVGAITADLRR